MENYEIWRSIDGGTTYGSTAYAYIEKTQINFTDYNCNNNFTYYYKIKAVDKNGSASDFSSAVSATPSSNIDITAPSKPLGLSATGNGLNSINIMWNYNSEGDLAGYNIYRDTDPNFVLSENKKINASIIPVGFNPNFIDKNAVPGITYYYAVSAVDDFLNESLLSDKLSVKLTRLTFTVDMGSISAANVSLISNIPYIGWSPGVTMTLDSGTAYSYTGDFVVNNTFQYKFAYNDISIAEQNFSTGSGNRELTAPDAISNKYILDWQENPDAVTNLVAQPDNRAAWLYWTPNLIDKDLKGYNIYKQYGADFVKVNTSIVTTNYYKIENLSNNYTYSFTVRAVDSGNMELESDNSNVVSATPRGAVHVHFRN